MLAKRHAHAATHAVLVLLVKLHEQHLALAVKIYLAAAVWWNSWRMLLDTGDLERLLPAAGLGAVMLWDQWLLEEGSWACCGASRVEPVRDTCSVRKFVSKHARAVLAAISLVSLRFRVS